MPGFAPRAGNLPWSLEASGCLPVLSFVSSIEEALIMRLLCQTGLVREGWLDWGKSRNGCISWGWETHPHLLDKKVGSREQFSCPNYLCWETHPLWLISSEGSEFFTCSKATVNSHVKRARFNLVRGHDLHDWKAHLSGPDSCARPRRWLFEDEPLWSVIGNSKVAV